MDKQTRQLEVSNRERIYSFLVDYISKNGFSPSVREIVAGTGLSSICSVYRCLLKLEDEGKIEMKHNATRAIKVVGFQLVKMEESA